MKYYVIINGNSSLDIQGLAIESLPNISKPLIRTTREEIDGRDGDIITKLGYSAYDKTLNIGLWGNYDINEVIAFFNEEGVITFSNEPDKYYKFHILNRIDFVNQLEKFKKASITIHCQPFKYKEQEAKVIEEEAHTTSGISFNLSDTLEAPLEIDLKGNTSQTGTPTPSSPIPVNNVSGDNEINVDGKNLFDSANVDWYRNNNTSWSNTADTNTTRIRTTAFALKGGKTYTISGIPSGINFMGAGEFAESGGTNIGSATTSGNTFTLDANANYVFLLFGGSNFNSSTNALMKNANIQIEEGNQATPYSPYNGTTYNIGLITSKNKFNPQKIIVGYNLNSITGQTYEANDRNTLDYTKIEPNTTYSISGIVLKNICYYNESKTFISYTQTTTFTTPQNAKYVRISFDNTKSYSQAQLEEGTATPYEAYSDIELNKIGTYQDYIYKENDKWYLHKETGKVVLDGTENVERVGTLDSSSFRFSISGPNDLKTTNISDVPAGMVICNKFKEISNNDSYNNVSYGILVRANNSKNFIINCNEAKTYTDTQFKNWLTNNNVLVYYVLSSATNTEITYSPLIEQLNTLEQAQSKEGTTNINQVNNDLPFIIDLTYYTGDTSITITNDGNIYSKPLLELKGTGNINIYLNGIQVFVVSLNNEIIYIDTDKMEAYYQGTLKNRQVVGNYNNFKLQSGNNTIQVDGGYVEYLKITNYSRWV